MNTKLFVTSSYILGTGVCLMSSVQPDRALDSPAMIKLIIHYLFVTFRPATLMTDLCIFFLAAGENIILIYYFCMEHVRTFSFVFVIHCNGQLVHNKKKILETMAELVSKTVGQIKYLY